MARRGYAYLAFTLVELLVVVAILSLLASILAPSLRRAEEITRATVCSANLAGVGHGFTQYTRTFDGCYPYGVPRPAETMQHPHYQTWRDGRRGGGRPPQQQFWDLAFLRNQDAWLCPTDPHPGNYNWWDYDVHPDFDRGSSYMMSEQALFGVTWWKHHIFRATQIVEPSSFGLATDGWMCPNGWQWATVDPDFPWGDGVDHTRIDWNHSGTVSVLFGDGHLGREEQFGIALRLRPNPLRTDPLKTSG